MNASAEEKERLRRALSNHTALANKAKGDIDAVLNYLSERILASMQGNPLDDDGDAALIARFDSAALSIEAMRDLCVDVPKPKKAELVEEEEEDDNYTCSNLINVGKNVVIFGGENDQIKLDRVREATGLGKMLQWHGVPSVYKVIESIKSGNVSALVILISLIGHTEFYALNNITKAYEVVSFQVRKPGISTLIMSLVELDSMVEAGSSQERVEHSHIRGPFKNDPLAARWFATIQKSTRSFPLNTSLSLRDLLKQLNLDETVEGADTRRLGAVMTAMGWRRTTSMGSVIYKKVANVADVLSAVK